MIADIALRKKLNIAKKSVSDYKRLSTTQIIYSLAIYSVLFLFVSAFWRSGLEVYVLLLLLSGLFGYRSFKQRQHDQSSKQYVRTMLTSLMYLILFIGLVTNAYPREFHHTFEVMKYLADNDQGEKVNIDFRGQTWQNLLYGKSFFGEMKTEDGEFLILLQYLEEPEETPIIDRLKDTYRQYTLIEMSGNRRGKIWLARDLGSFAGAYSGSVKFAYPAESVDEAESIFRGIFNE